MENEAVVSVNLTLSEIKLIRELIAKDGVPTEYGETFVGVKMIKAEGKFK